MTGASIRHDVIACNLFAELRTHLKGIPCHALIEGAKNKAFYPDVMVICEDRLQELNITFSLLKQETKNTPSPTVPSGDRHHPGKKHQNQQAPQDN